jgi:hypothetical protein
LTSTTTLQIFAWLQKIQSSSKTDSNFYLQSQFWAIQQCERDEKWHSLASITPTHQQPNFKTLVIAFTISRKEGQLGRRKINHGST